MSEVDKILSQVEDCIRNNYYRSVETEKVELKVTPPNLKGALSLIQSVCSFLNTNGGIIVLGIKDNNNQATKNYQLAGYNDDFEETIKLIGTLFTDRDLKKLDLSNFIVHHEIKDFMDKRVCAIYIDKLPEELKYCFYESIAYCRKLTGDHKISENEILKREEFKEEIRNARELAIEKDATLEDIDLEKLDEYIRELNREFKYEKAKESIEAAKPFLTRKKFIIGEKVTTLGLLVCGRHVKDFLGWRSQVDCFVDSPFEVAQDKKSIVDNVIPLIKKSNEYILKNIQIGVSIEKGGTSKPEYPEVLLRETINNAIAHRDYSINKYISINIKPNVHLEIRNPGSFKKQLLIEIPDHEVPVRRIIPDSKPLNPNLADVLKVFNFWEGKARGMGNLVNEALENRIDLPYYRFYSREELGLFIQKGKLIDDNFISLLETFDLFLETKLNGSSLTEEEIAVLAYFYKSEIANREYRHTIMLTPDNNHFNAIQRLQKSGLISKHPESPELYPVFMVHRDLTRTEYTSELRNIFGGSFDNLPEIHKQALSTIYQVNCYSKNKSISATQAGRVLFYKTKQPLNDIKAFDNFKRKVYDVFKRLVESEFLIHTDRKYFINTSFKRKPSLFD